jgi:hypothetical protein
LYVQREPVAYRNASKSLGRTLSPFCASSVSIGTRIFFSGLVLFAGQNDDDDGRQPTIDKLKTTVDIEHCRVASKN